MYQILIVDEEEHLLWALERNLFPQRTDVQVHTAASGEKGLEILSKESIDLLISDIKMPGEVDGFQLILRAKEMVPDARVMIITAFGTQRIQNFAERIGISHYIEKPFTVEELREAILEILDEKEGFQGVLSDLELTDIIQMLCLAKRTALLHLKHRDHRGRIVFDAGEVTHAEFDGIQGAEAVYEMLDLRQGDIFMQSDFEPTDRTIEMGWQDLLLEGVRRTDERRLEQAQQKSRELSQASMVEESEAFEGGEGRGEKQRTMTPMGLATMGDFELGETSAASEGLGEASGSTMLFSEAELEEMVAASEAAVGTGDEVVTAKEVEEIQAKEERRRRGTSPGMASVAPETSEESREIELFAAPALNGRHGAESALSDEAVQALEEFLEECPGMVATAVLQEMEPIFGHARDAEAKELVVQASSARMVEVFQRGQRCVGALHRKDTLEEIQIAVGDHYLLMRSLNQGALLHVVVVERQVSLGIALVLMRQLERRLQATAGETAAAQPT